MKKALLISGIVLGTLAVFFAGFFIATNSFYENKFFPGVSLAGLDLSSRSYAEGAKIIRQQAKVFESGEVEIKVDGDFVEELAFADLGYEPDIEMSILKAYEVGRTGNVLEQTSSRLSALLSSETMPIVQTRDEEVFFDTVSKKLNSHFKEPVKNARLEYTGGRLLVSPSSAGQSVKVEELSQILQSRVEALSLEPVRINSDTTQPWVSKAKAEEVKGQIEKTYFEPLKLKAPSEDFIVQEKDLRAWLDINNGWKDIKVGVKHEPVTIKLQQVKRLVDQDEDEAVLEIEGETVKKFSPGRDGYHMSLEQSLKAIEEGVLNPDREVDLAVEVTPTNVSLTEVGSRLGIKELIARGTSNFSGSPANRRHNIGVGAARFRNVLIKPGEKFSFNARLGNVDGSTGYLPELVIKGDQTIPEFGGGLCQVSTTAFRSVLNAGLPVNERRNHSYQVVYYSPAGTDATIYPGSADLKFTNDTGHYILMTNYIRGDELVFELYGTKPNYTAEVDDPIIWDVTAFPEPVYIDTDTLPVGVTKRVDTAHRGAKAKLVRRIKDENGKVIRTDEFLSNYVAWPAKYLRGAEAAPTVEADPGNIPPPQTSNEQPIEDKPTTTV